MVDYTQPAMRDETWRRWKGGVKLADQLRVFYTNKRALDRIAAANPALPEKPARNGSHKRTRIVDRIHDNVMIRQKRRLMRAANAKAAMPTATQPGQDAPTR